MELNRFSKYAWGVLAFNIGVILWGAYVRATGSGAGCGSHWPLCNGVVIPIEPQIETVIEFIHRLTSGTALLLVVGMFIWAMRVYPKEHAVRTAANFSLFFIITEALVGAGLVLFQWVALNDSIERVISMAVHLVNTFLLLAALTLTAWWGSGGRPARIANRGWQIWAFGLAYLALMMLGVTGAITALGDTLFPAGSLQEGVIQDFSATSHFLIRLRIWHPLIAIMSGTYILVLAGLTAMYHAESWVKRFTMILIGLFLIQIIAGLVNLVLLAPITMQITHLLLADMVWIALVLFGAAHFADYESE